MSYSCENISQAVVDGAQYTYRIGLDGQACIEKCSCASDCVRIPDALGGCPVTSIGDGAFAKQSHIVSVVCPRALKHIRSHAFEGCLKLRSIALNAGLESIGEEAFFLCGALDGLDVPATVETFGPHPLGTSKLAPARSGSPFEVRFSPDSDKLFFDAHGVLYERRQDGLLLVDGYRFEGKVLVCEPSTVEIGAKALSRMPSLEEAVLPAGLRRIGDEAFRGCTGLARVNLPDTLESIGAAAFSSTAIESLEIPARCTSIDRSAFALGPIAVDGSACPYDSRLAAVRVHPGNPRFCMHGGMLCERNAEGGLEAALVPREAERVSLDGSVALVRRTALAGTKAIGTLSIAEGVRFESECGVPEGIAIGAVELAPDACGASPFALRMDGIPVGRTLRGGRFSTEAFLAAYDSAVAQVPDTWRQAKLAVERLARPYGMAPDASGRFRAFVQANLEPICIEYGHRGEFAGFDCLADADILNAGNVAALIEALSASGDAQAAGYVLELRQGRFGAASWDDYEL